MSGIAGAASTWRAGLRARLGQRGGEPAVEARDGQRRGQRQHAPDRARAARDRLAARRVGRVGEDLLDRRGEHGLAAVLADRLGDRAGVAPVAVDRRAREAGPDAGAVDRLAGHADEDPRPVVGRRVARDDVDDLDVERADLRPPDHRVAGALHARPQLRQRHDRIAGVRDARSDAREEGRPEGGGEEAGAHQRRHCSAGIRTRGSVTRRSPAYVTTRVLPVVGGQRCTIHASAAPPTAPTPYSTAGRSRSAGSTRGGPARRRAGSVSGRAAQRAATSREPTPRAAPGSTAIGASASTSCPEASRARLKRCGRRRVSVERHQAQLRHVRAVRPQRLDELASRAVPNARSCTARAASGPRRSGGSSP